MAVFGFLAVLFLCTSFLYAAPLEKGFTLAPPDSASAEEKATAFRNARLRVIAAAEKYERTPYRYGGTDNRGVDCSGLIYISFRDALGVTVPRTTSGLHSWAEKIKMQDAGPGDLVFFITTGKTVSHVGIYLGNGRFIHAASEGPSTGVIYSTLDESYWSRTYIGMGRVLPAADISSNVGNTVEQTSVQTKETGRKKTAKQKDSSKVLFGLAAAPTWKHAYIEGPVVRGIAGQCGVAVQPFQVPMTFGMDLRPEWDGSLGVFRVPFTISWGINSKVCVFAGPVVSFGDAALSIDGESRPYTGGTTWFGAAGITVMPFAIKIAKGHLAPYGEVAWQSYKNDITYNAGADFAASFRFSTGLSYIWRK